ncbi:pyridoxamine 5'-phosphate oxidase family protein [Corynebacterium sp. TAE3-ERU12]|uniref:pyridoxamine 5'-phosphate oxidase family protein n=1 Tax=Corynebacterium sp. TAE3-ERU12 TaxID=2849491 RepID=UPI001C46748E|nr:pyridoxamine 5'-phosphate oxidase family protein [Corynebacterium sp. TAE3-ERU12]MBV7295176.1 pyridoxamine 5'-phosphate oxidase family protein [Corynebacterium sp. TAE3-ERU12]
MATIDSAMQQMLAEQLPILATVTDGSTPNIGPKRSLRAFGDDKLIYNENTGGQHLANIEAGSKVAVAVIDRPNLDGYRFLGTAETTTEGEAWDNCIAFAKENGMPEPKRAVVIHVEEIYSLKSGAKAGTRVDENK